MAYEIKEERTDKVDYNQNPLIGGAIREVTITLAEYRELVEAKRTLEVLIKLGKVKA